MSVNRTCVSTLTTFFMPVPYKQILKSRATASTRTPPFSYSYQHLHLAVLIYLRFVRATTLRGTCPRPELWFEHCQPHGVRLASPPPPSFLPCQPLAVSAPRSLPVSPCSLAHCQPLAVTPSHSHLPCAPSSVSFVVFPGSCTHDTEWICAVYELCLTRHWQHGDSMSVRISLAKGALAETTAPWADPIVLRDD